MPAAACRGVAPSQPHLASESTALLGPRYTGAGLGGATFLGQHRCQPRLTSSRRRLHPLRARAIFVDQPSLVSLDFEHSFESTTLH